MSTQKPQQGEPPSKRLCTEKGNRCGDDVINQHAAAEDGAMADTGTVAEAGTPEPTLPFVHELQVSQAALVLKCCNEFPLGAMVQAPTGHGKTCILYAMGRLSNFQAHRTRGKRIDAVLMITTSALVQQHRQEARRAGFADNCVFPPKNQSYTFASDLPDFIYGAKGENLIIVSKEGFGYGIRTRSKWVNALCERSRTMSVLVDEVHTQMLKTQRNPTATLKNVSELANMFLKKKDDVKKASKTHFAVFGASASLDESTLIGKILMKGAENYDDNAISTRLLKRAQKLCNARDEAVRELFNKPPPAELPAVPYVRMDAGTLKDELEFSTDAEVITKNILTKNVRDNDLRQVQEWRLMFFNSMMPQSSDSDIDAKLHAKALRLSLDMYWTEEAFSYLTSPTDMVSEKRTYRIGERNEERCAIYGIACATARSCQHMVNLLEEQMANREEGCIAIEKVIQMSTRTKDADFRRLEGLLTGKGDDPAMKKGRVVAVFPTELLQGHCGFHLYFLKIYVVSVPSAKSNVLIQAKGRFGRSTIGARVCLQNSRQALVHYDFDGPKKMREARAQARKKRQIASLAPEGDAFDVSELSKWVPTVCDKALSSETEEFKAHYRFFKAGGGAPGGGAPGGGASDGAWNVLKSVKECVKKAAQEENESESESDECDECDESDSEGD